jgi:phosphate transport system permease protein
VSFGADEYRVMVWALFPDGTIRATRLDNGGVIEERRVFENKTLTAFASSVAGDRIALGFSDGTVQIGAIGFVTDYPVPASLPESLRSLEAGEVEAFGEAAVEKTPEGQLRRQRLSVKMNPPVAVDSTRSIILLDIVDRDIGPILAVLTSDGALRLSTVRQIENFMTGEISQTLTAAVLPPPLPGSSGVDGAAEDWPSKLAILENGSGVVLVWPDGRLLRYETRDMANARIAERVPRFESAGARFTAAQMLLGDGTLLVGENDGDVSAWFRHRPHDAETSDGAVLVAARRFEGTGAAVTAVASSPRARVAAVGYADGRIRLFQVTSGAKILELSTDPGDPVIGLRITPKNDGLLALTSERLWHWSIDMGYPEATLRALFAPVWYEGHEDPSHVWQSSSGTDDFEPKFGMWPLVFGTLKATLYSMLLGAPIALLAAIFSSEFLAPALRTRLKTLIEFMASLPSVVLGFIAALVFAPFVQSVVPTTLAAFVTIPGVILVGAYVWQLIPHGLALRLARYRLAFILALLPAGLALAAGVGPAVERIFFLGNMKLWLDGNEGGAIGGWFILLLPASALVVAASLAHYLGPWFREKATTMNRAGLAILDFGRFIAVALMVVAVALLAAWILELAGADPRGEGRFLGTYVQRNALIVGVAMGFAIIPIIYTIAEDALSAVPEHLRAASLGSGATPWQTALRIVIPTAMSGLFSALMIGLGRAVGETMIVLMAAGNTPILDINIFNGFRTLSANIAVELPEAVKGSTHYRTLFLAALILFAITFVINTIAEMVRQRFRKRAYQL